MTSHADRGPTRDGERGQALVVFALALVAIIGMCGLIIDAGGAYAQRRVHQNVADLAAMAGATTWLNTPGSFAVRTAAAEAAARDVAADNGYAHDPANGTIVTVDVAMNGSLVSVNAEVTAPHQNYFAGVLGQPSWQVSAEATAETSAVSANAAVGAMPLIFNEEAFEDPRYSTSPPGQLFNLPGTGSEDVPQDATQFNWTIFCLASGNPCNGNSDGVRDLIRDLGTSFTVGLGDEIGPLNAGAHTTLFNAIESQRVDGNFSWPVAIVCTVNQDPTCPEDGALVGWALFNLTSVEGGSDRVIRGYFSTAVADDRFTLVDGPTATCPQCGVYSVQLVD